jgi:6-phosphofructokinase 1
MLKKKINRIAVFTSGGDAPGMNAAIRAVVRTAIYHDIAVYGIERGYDGMIKGDIKRLESRHVGNIIHRGGTMLRTARSEDFKTPEGRKKAYDHLQAHEIDACVAIGGNGTFTGAKIFNQEFDIPFIGIPGTIDNDLYGTDFSIGFDTAINTAMEAADKIRDTADSHDRLFFIEVMGRASGYIGLFTGIGAGAGGILIPEDDMNVEQLVDKLKKGVKRKKLFSLVVISEGNIHGGAYEIAEKVKKYYDFFDTKVTVIGHLQRGGSPTCADRVLASRLGYGAVMALMNGETNKMVGVLNNEIAFTSFDEAINKSKTFAKDLFQVASILGL